MNEMSRDAVVDFAIVMTSGPDTPMRLASPFFLAATAAAEERAVVMYFTGLGTLLLQKGVAEQVYPKAGGKSVADFMRLAQGNGVKLTLCKTSMDLHGLQAEDMISGVPMLSVTEALPYLEAAKKLLSF
ncbi:MAG: DsrE/DsrF/DrsH-like family protein [Acidiferrobacter sp.]